ncbi:hypothetical protein [Methanothermococcus okinawensis]|uniref:Uncharacterized protein n=1 Tax=Methanothermococcus okinawensis (strain DSM 14208 / JCM 11175 / IH1) TaxID=647113 RepID=F8ANQ6_METOI|nr:hypothetical protein [Methanothermococcus okinawensis]AEH06254.1 hypothetical protein Metok_0262 [Methanothermococcus okinawensis IH1]
MNLIHINASLMLIIILLLITVLIIVSICLGLNQYLTYKKAKKSWRVLYYAEMDLLENFKHNLGMSEKEYLIMVFILILSSLIFIDDMALRVITITTMISLVIILKKSKIRKVNICDKGVILDNGRVADYWKDFKGYKRIKIIFT